MKLFLIVYTDENGDDVYRTCDNEGTTIERVGELLTGDEQVRLQTVHEIVTSSPGNMKLLVPALENMKLKLWRV